MTIYSLDVYWPNTPIQAGYQASPDDLLATVPLGAMIPSPTQLPQVISVNGRSGVVSLTAADVNADAAGAALAVLNQLIAALEQKLDAVDYIEHHLGLFTSKAELDAAHPTARPGDSADIDSGAGFDVMRAIWDNSDNKWVVREVNNAQNTDQVPEGSNNLYYTGTRVRATPLTGLAAGTNAQIFATDTVLSAFAKLQAQISANPAAPVWVDLEPFWDQPAVAFGDTSVPAQNKLQVAKINGMVWLRGLIRRISPGGFFQGTPIAELPPSYKLLGVSGGIARSVSGITAYWEGGVINIQCKPDFSETTSTIFLSSTISPNQPIYVSGILGVAANP